jgi:SAM-dependent methyltransferase
VWEWQYDELARSYDDQFRRPVDGWEDDRLTALLAPVVNGRDVLDLGCGTGWLLDHLEPACYTGLDESAPMLAALTAKHPHALVIKTSVGAEGWRESFIWRGDLFDTITATWSAQYLGSMRSLLPDLAVMVRPGGHIALHGYLPRYRRRRHEITRQCSPQPAPPVMTPRKVRAGSARAGLGSPQLRGTGALPDALARYRLAWQAAAVITPARWHYAGLWTWEVPR